MRLLVPPSGSVPGDVLYLAGGSATEAAAKQVKSDDWKKIVEGLSVQVRTRGEDALYRYTVFVCLSLPEGFYFLKPKGIPSGVCSCLGCCYPHHLFCMASLQGSQACYTGVSLVTSHGPITLPSEVPDGSGIH